MGLGGGQLAVHVNCGHSFPRFKGAKLGSIIKYTLGPGASSFFPWALDVYLEGVCLSGSEESES